MSGEELIRVLRTIERRCRKCGVELLEQGKPRQVWTGISFVVGGSTVLSPLEDIAELLEVPQDITRVPSAKPWVCGVANNRGTLLPIFDLQAFLFGLPTARNPRNRVLVVRQPRPFGLLVGDVLGIRHFEMSARESKPAAMANEFQHLLSGGFTTGQMRYPVVSLPRLGLDSRFNVAAA